MTDFFPLQAGDGTHDLMEWENVSTTAPALPTAAEINLIFKKPAIP